MRRIDPLAMSNLSLPAKWLGVFMAVHENRNGEVIATLSEICAWTSLSTRAIQYGLEDLQQAGFISVLTPFQRTANSSAKFALTLRDAPDASPLTHLMRQVVSETSQSDTGRLNAEAVAELSELPSPYKERTSETPSGFSPVISSSSVLSSSNGLENEQLGIEGISNTPAWLTDLRTTPGYNLDAARERRLIQRVDAAAISAQRLCEAATSIAAKWESVKWSPTNKRGYKCIDLTFVAWAKREGFNGNGTPVDVDPLDAYRKSYGRYMKVAP